MVTTAGTRSAFALAAFRAARGLASVVKNALAAQVNRSEIGCLQHMDDRQLKDIGLMRTDVAAALAAPLLRDPSRQLVSAAGERRALVHSAWRNDLRRQDALVKASAPTSAPILSRAA